MAATKSETKSYTKPTLEKRAKLVDVAETITFVSGVEVLN